MNKYSVVVVVLLAPFVFACTRPIEDFDDSPKGPQESWPLFRFCENGKWGYVNRKGRVVIAPRFRVAYDFSDGRATVKEVRRLGYIDRQGRFAFTLPEDCLVSYDRCTTALLSLSHRRGKHHGGRENTRPGSILPVFG